MPIFTREQLGNLLVNIYARLIRIAKAFLSNDDDAIEIVHDAVVQFLKEERTIELRERTPEEALRVYLSEIVRNCAIAKWHQRKRERLIQEKLEAGCESLFGALIILSPENERLLTEGVSDETKKKIERLPPKLKTLCLFLLKHIDEEPSQHWLLWAKENDLDLTDQRLRNTFDKLKERLREKFNSNGVERNLTTGRRGGNTYEN
ncbi:MAG: hypothetical protein HYZ50_05765 [Deltaproteobacteria bacterium]|nr:hypothetical protein [Deltaproteobacteria bacterium]